MDKQNIINEIKRTAKGNGGKPLGAQRFSQATGIKECDWLGKHWARWGDAVSEAGYEPNSMQGSYSDEYIIQKFVSLIVELDKYPVATEIKIKARHDKSFPSHTVFSRVGKKHELARKVVEYCKGKRELRRVVEICEPILTTSKPSSNIPKENKLTDGFVYLIRSGRYYKIGKTNDIGRRKYDLKIQLPEEIKEVHSIRTDDPGGIEAYWHKRFQAKRKQGEWFDLTSDDVKVFKRRQFM